MADAEARCLDTGRRMIDEKAAALESVAAQIAELEEGALETVQTRLREIVKSGGGDLSLEELQVLDDYCRLCLEEAELERRSAEDGAALDDTETWISKEAYQMTPEEFRNCDPAIVTQNHDKVHKWIVEQAIEEGLDVPDEVLSHYPELRK